jgi:glucan phosphoethanolaminetransferase (alkaline phosphatase superfamily)
MNDIRRNLWAWAIRIAVTLILLSIAIIIFFSTVFTAKWLISVKEKSDNAAYQAAENAGVISENKSNIRELQEKVDASPTPTPASIQGTHKSHPHKTQPLPWWRRIF